MAEARRGRRRGRPVLAQRGEAGRRRRRRGRQGAGRPHGADAARPGRAAPARPTRPTPPRSPSATWPTPRCASGSPPPRGTADGPDRLAAGHPGSSAAPPARCWSRWPASATGSRPGRSPRRRLGDVGAEVFVWIHHHVREDAQSLYGFATRDERDLLRGADRRPRRRPGAGPGHPLGPPARRAAPGPGRRRRGRPVPRARRRQEDRGPPAGRAQVPARPARRRDRRGRRRQRRRRLAGHRPPAPTSRDALVEPRLRRRGDRPTRSATCPRATTAGVLLKEALRQLAVDRALSAAPDARRAARAGDRPTRWRRPPRSGSGPAGSTTSSARPSSRSTSRSSWRRPARRGAGRRPPALRRPARAWARRRLARIVATEMDVGAARHLGPGARAGRRPGRHPHPARRGRRALHRRDPPAVPGRRGGALPGDGGLPARHRAGQGPGRPLDPPRPPPLHPGRRHHPHRPDHRPAARPLRPRRPARLLRARRPRGHRRAGGRRSSSVPSTPTGAARSPGRARGTPRIANRLLRRVRDFAEVRGDGTVDHDAAKAGWPGLRRGRAGPRQGRPRRSSSALCERFGGGPVGLSNPGHRRRRADRDRRGRLRAVPHPQGLLMRTPRGPGRHPGGLGPPRPRRAVRRRPGTASGLFG